MFSDLYDADTDNAPPLRHRKHPSAKPSSSSPHAANDLYWVHHDPEIRERILRSSPFFDWYETEMVNIIFLSLAAQVVVFIAFGAMFFVESTTWRFLGSGGLLAAAIVYTAFWVFFMAAHYFVEFIYWIGRGRSTYNSQSLENCRRVWCVRLCVVGSMLFSVVVLWVFYGTHNGLEPMKDFYEQTVEAHGGTHGNLLLLHKPQRLAYTYLMFALGLVQIMALITVSWHMMGYDMGDDSKRVTARYLKAHPDTAPAPSYSQDI